MALRTLIRAWAVVGGVLALAGCSSTGSEPAAAPPAVHADPDLTFSGAVFGNATQAVAPLPVKSGAHYDYNTPSWSTQCIMPADDGAWSATTTVRINGTRWELSIGNPGFGLPVAGSHTAVAQTSTRNHPGSVWIALRSDRLPDGTSNGDILGYAYGIPAEHGDATVVIDPGLTSGTVDAWFTSLGLTTQDFHIGGKWSCA